ncbi:Manganese transport system membrane protein MntB [Roseibaca ekhonensis]|jgi:manganese/zinc/iron transport system permease protein|uniref:Manganese transport system membrane protein MntB n=1 Tax=Roseinatronobacter ekhonensis TaxID=254356 RepID=A0A3B0M5U6_9RHOB|nr:Manganese transport system membrane protein MntB [Roseibaca ekhonensis]
MSLVLDALTLQAGYNAALVATGAALLGVAAGASGSFLLLRKRALVSDAVAHAALPGIVLAFMVMVAFGGAGRSLAGLLLGAALSGGVGLLAMTWITKRTRLAEDAAIGAVLGVFFGAGVVLLTLVQTMQAGRQAGLEGFLLGSTAGMLREDAILIALGGAVVLALCWLMRRPMTLVAFDPAYAATLGYNTRAIDLAMMGLATAVTVIGLKLVGLVLIVALLIIPPAAARFWTERTGVMVWVAGGIGGAGAYLGAAISATAPALPTGPIIVLVLAAGFTLSMLFAPARGILGGALRHARLRRQMQRGE